MWHKRPPSVKNSKITTKSLLIIPWLFKIFKFQKKIVWLLLRVKVQFVTQNTLMILKKWTFFKIASPVQIVLVLVECGDILSAVGGFYFVKCSSLKKKKKFKVQGIAPHFLFSENTTAKPSPFDSSRLCGFCPLLINGHWNSVAKVFLWLNKVQTTFDKLYSHQQKLRSTVIKLYTWRTDFRSFMSFKRKIVVHSKLQTTLQCQSARHGQANWHAFKNC